MLTEYFMSSTKISDMCSHNSKVAKQQTKKKM